MPVEIKSIGSSGQISLGKQYAGRTITGDQVAEGVWTIKTAQVIPDDELWSLTGRAREVWIARWSGRRRILAKPGTSRRWRGKSAGSGS